MPFRKRGQTKEEILNAAASEADRLGVEEYLVVVRRRGALVVVADEDEIEEGDSFVGVVTDAKGGLE